MTTKKKQSVLHLPADYHDALKTMAHLCGMTLEKYQVQILSNHVSEKMPEIRDMRKRLGL
jgi:hypothetical protein